MNDLINIEILLNKEQHANFSRMYSIAENLLYSNDIRLCSRVLKTDHKGKSEVIVDGKSFKIVDDKIPKEKIVKYFNKVKQK